MKTSQRIYLLFKRLIGILDSFVGFIFLRQWAIPSDARNEERLSERSKKYTPSALSVKLGIKGYTEIKMKMDYDPEFKAEWDSKYVESTSLCPCFKAFYLYSLNLFCALKGR